jgi:hypothetical protein
VWDDFHANFASYIEDKHFEDGVGIPNKLPWRRQGFLCLSIELERRGRIFGGIPSGLEWPLESWEWEVGELPS